MGRAAVRASVAADNPGDMDNSQARERLLDQREDILAAMRNGSNMEALAARRDGTPRQRRSRSRSRSRGRSRSRPKTPERWNSVQDEPDDAEPVPFLNGLLLAQDMD